MRRVVVTGLGVVAPNGVGIQEFELALRKGRSGVSARSDLAAMGFRCTVAGVPPDCAALARAAFRPDILCAMNASQSHAGLAALEAWSDADLAPVDPRGGALPDAGAIIGTGVGDLDVARRVIHEADSGRIRSLGSTAVEQLMASGVSARVGGLLGLGNQVTTNASACSTGTESILAGYRRIQQGLAERMLCGGVEGASPYLWAGFDAMGVLCRRFNDAPTRASRPLSASAAGFVPAAGAGILVLEAEECARARGARVYAEVMGGAITSGGQRSGGTMSSPSPSGARRCIRNALADARLSPADIDLINGHFTATGADVLEIRNWKETLGKDRPLPRITATKALTGHALSAAGAIESVACLLMLRSGFIHPAINCEDLHPEIEPLVSALSVECEDARISTVVKASFGFGDVNACVIFRRWQE